MTGYKELPPGFQHNRKGKKNKAGQFRQILAERNFGLADEMIDLYQAHMQLAYAPNTSFQEMKFHMAEARAILAEMRPACYPSLRSQEIEHTGRPDKMTIVFNLPPPEATPIFDAKMGKVIDAIPQEPGKPIPFKMEPPNE